MAFRKLLGKLAAVTVGALVASNSAFAFFMGDTIHGEYLSPDQSTIYANLGNTVINPGVEYSLVVDGIPIDVDFSDSLINILFSPAASSNFSAASFSGFRFSDALNNIADIANVKILSSDGITFDSSSIAFDANNIFLNFANADVSPGSSLSLQVSLGEESTPISAPGSIVLLGLGLLGMGYVRNGKLNYLPKFNYLHGSSFFY